MATRRLCALTLFALFAAPPAPAAAPFDSELYARLLLRYTRAVDDTAGVRVDYRALRGSEDWQRLVANLGAVDPASLDGRDAKLAFFINAYNILAIEVVRRSDPVDSIRDVGSILRSVWRRKAGRIGGQPITLHEIEHEILRPLGDPRVHAAIVCASTSCPSLRREPFDAAHIDAQLDEVAARFVADRRKGAAFDRASRTLELSKIFDWFESDFEAGGGVLAFVRRHAEPELARFLARNAGRVRVEHFDYDWRLNDLAAPDQTSTSTAPSTTRTG